MIIINKCYKTHLCKLRRRRKILTPPPNPEIFLKNNKNPRLNSEKTRIFMSRAKREENFGVFLRLKTAILSKISTF